MAKGSQLLRSCFRALALCAAVVGLAACHADVTYRFDLHSDRQVAVTIRQVFDDELYRAMMRKMQSPVPLWLDSAQREGWAVSRSTDDLTNHVITLTKTIPLDALLSGQGGFPMATGSGGAAPFQAFSVQKNDGILTDLQTISGTIPNPMASQQNNPFAGAGANIVSSAVAVHLELRAPGTVVATNGETLPDGFTRWNINLDAPTDVRLTVRAMDLAQSAAVALFALAGIILLTYLLRRPRQQAQREQLTDGR
jgi:hypothetical protein